MRTTFFRPTAALDFIDFIGFFYVFTFLFPSPDNVLLLRESSRKKAKNGQKKPPG